MGRLQRQSALGFITPLRYPGGKRRLVYFFQDLIECNDLIGARYVEPFAGGAGLALSLLVSGYVGEVYLNDLDVAIYIFWKTVLEKPEELCQRIKDVSIDIETWKHQREVITHPGRYSEVEVALAAFYLNRTNRSGILRGGVIGGLEQSGKWKMSARFNKEDLVRRIRRIAAYKDRIQVYNQEAVQFLHELPQRVPLAEKCLVYADPPYYARGHSLYYDHYRPEDHQRLARAMRALPCPWVVSYDDVDAVYILYQGVSYFRYQLHYAAQTRRYSGEVMFLHDLVFPPLKDTEQWHPVHVVGGCASIPA